MRDEEHPAAAFSRWSLALSDAQQKALEILGRTPLPDATNALHGWALATLTWATEVRRALDGVAAQLAVTPPPPPVPDAGPTLVREGARLLSLFNAFVDAIGGAAEEIAVGRAEDISEAAMLALADFPWLALETARMRFAAAADLLPETDATRWFLLTRAHIYAARRDLEHLEHEARLDGSTELASLLSAVDAAEDAISCGRNIVAGKQRDPAALAEPPVMGDVFRSYAHSFDVFAALIKAWRRQETGWSSNDGDARHAAIEASCVAWSRAETAIDRHQQERAEMLREATRR